jgi:hypothetical protein
VHDEAEFDSDQKGTWYVHGWNEVRFGSEADIPEGLRDVRFTPESRH